jgi:hypothetical protein
MRHNVGAIVESTTFEIAIKNITLNSVWFMIRQLS